MKRAGGVVGLAFGIGLFAGCAASLQPGGARAYIDGFGDEWRSLNEGDFVDVNGLPETWVWRAGVLQCSGEPIGVLRTEKEYRNFEMVLEWRHLRDGGNSGVFLWVSREALARLAPGELPREGIEVQMLDHDFTRQWQAQGGSSEWFTTNGDVFPVGRSKLTPFPPVSPDGIRSFPSAERSKGAGEWNHYYVRAINGEVRLWVNGEEVSGGRGAEPRHGFLALEAEGSPVEFRNIRLRELD